MKPPTVPLVLASQSPRRQSLLEEAGYAFTIMHPDESVECGVCTNEGPAELVLRLGREKARDVASRIDGEAIVIGCDTVAECQGQILGKPADREHAEQMLRRMSGKPHRVYSGVCLWRRPDNLIQSAVVVSHLLMDNLEEGPLQAYLDSGLWEGKAGGFGYQDGLDWVRLTSGSASNVVGLPMERLAELLATFGDSGADGTGG